MSNIAIQSAPNTRLLGMNPLVATLLALALIFGATIGVLGLLFASGDGALVFVAALFSLALIFMLFPTAAMLGAAVAGCFHHLRARKAITRGGFRPDWVLRGHSCNGVVMANERDREIYVNGRIYRFEDIRGVTWSIEPRRTQEFWLTFMVKDRYLRVGFDNQFQLQTAFMRLRSSLGLS